MTTTEERKRELWSQKLQSLVSEKAEFAALPKPLVLSKIALLEKKNPKLWRECLKLYEKESSEKQFLKKQAIKEAVKFVRAELRVVYSSFLSPKHAKKEKLLASCKTEDKVLELLTLHKSSKERFAVYEELYERIFLWSGKTNNIVDIACGFNPLSFSLLRTIFGKKLKVFACDMNKDDMEFLQAAATKFSWNLKTKAVDVMSEECLTLPEVNDPDSLVFLFKALDSFEHVQRHWSKHLVSRLPAKKLVVSFALNSLGAHKKFETKNRGSWFVKYCEKNGWSCEPFVLGSELYVLVKKNYV